MGDSRRFNLFAQFIRRTFPPERFPKVADIAGGKGYLQLALRENGYNVVTFDKRKGYSRIPNFNGQYRLFNGEIGNIFDLLVGMHPDEATDIIIQEAGRRRIPFAIVPCCVKPTVSRMRYSYNFSNWIIHLKEFAVANSLTVNETYLRMTGKRLVLYGSPK